jgi:hypothetical protein
MPSVLTLEPVAVGVNRNFLVTLKTYVLYAQIADNDVVCTTIYPAPEWNFVV